MTKDEARGRVAKGAALLDACRPGWAERMNLDELNLSDCEHCILAQEGRQDGSAARSPYHYMCELLAPDLDATPWTWPVAYGFDVLKPASPKAFKLLQEAWVEVIAARRVKAAEAEAAFAVLMAYEPELEEA